MKNKKITIIGGGVMGGAILENLLQNKIFKSNEIVVSEPSKKRANFLNKKYKVRVFDNNQKAIEGSKIVLLSVKPQHACVVFKDLKGVITNNQTVISIMAGISLANLKKGLRAKNIVRSMPNTPAQIGKGMIVWKKVGNVNIKQMKRIFKAMGEEIEVKEEKFIDVATAISGSGPAYVFLFMENLIKEAMRLGFEEKEAEGLIKQTFWGSINLVLKSKKSPAELREAVTSKKGTTEAALKVFKKKKLEIIFKEAIKAALKRALQLRKKYG